MCTITKKSKRCGHILDISIYVSTDHLPRPWIIYSSESQASDLSTYTGGNRLLLLTAISNPHHQPTSKYWEEMYLIPWKLLWQYS